jgi:hypothetical protein
MKTFVAAVLTMSLLAVAPANPQASGSRPPPEAPQWGAFQPGPYRVGFRSMHRYDRSRGYFPRVDHEGNRDPLETARPMQISVWYPAGPAGEGSEPMRFGEYVDLEGQAFGPDRSSPASIADARESLRRGPLNPFFPDGVSDADLRSVLETPTAAYRDAPAAEGRFPIVVHAGFSLIGQSVLLEYLASHGYVVVSVPLLGTAPAWYHRGEGTPRAYQAGADDIGFLLAEASGLEFADPERTAVIGMFSANGLLFQMQHMRLDALAVLDGSYPDALRDVPGFDPTAVRIPILDMPRAGSRPDRAMLDSLRFADRWSVAFEDVGHGDFYQFERIARPERADEHVAYHVIGCYTRAFLDATLKDDAEARRFLSLDPDETGAPPGMMDIAFRAGEDPVPTESEFLRLIREGEADTARRAWERGDAPLADEGSFTTTLMFLRRDAGPNASLEGFRLLADMYPRSWRARERLGSTLRLAGDGAAALAAYRAALRLLEEAEPAPEGLEGHRQRLGEAVADLESEGAGVG